MIILLRPKQSPRAKAVAAAFFLLAGTLLAAVPAYSQTAPAVADEDKLPVERYALYVASNDGGEGRERLRYARSDAKRLAATMSEVGGVDSANSLILVDPTRAEVDDAFKDFADSIRRNANRSRRTEFIFYYSGHSSESALMLGDESYDYSELKAELSTVPSDVHVVMLDSCYSGNFIRSKGGSRQKPFLMDDSTIVKGHAYLSSSSEREESQESDAIQASYFTQALVTGLRGAADASGDKRVSLNELYYYAFNETLSKTESSMVGPQHPSYNITLVGSGDLVLTDIAEAESVLNIPASFDGRFFIRNPDGLLMSEINKVKGTEVSLALPTDSYTIAIVTPTTTSQANVYLGRGQRVTLESKKFSVIKRSEGRSRGDADEEEGYGSHQAVGISVFPGMSIPSPMPDLTNISLGIFMADNRSVFGVQASSFMGTMSGELRGLQGAGFMNNSSGEILGLQAAGFMNNSSGEWLMFGGQAAGFMNNANGDIQGGQAAGFLNNGNGNLVGLQSAGFLNNLKGDLAGVQAAGFLNNAKGYVTGVQAAGFLNNVGGGFKGLQTAGFLNVASQSSVGVQAGGFLNIADEISGAQIGFINVARKNNGASIGLFNFIADGVMSPSAYIDSNRNYFIQYQGGTDRFFTTFLIGTQAESPECKTDFAILGFGIGTKIRATSSLSFDIELIQKQVFDIASLVEIAEESPDHRILVSTDDEETKRSLDPETKRRLDAYWDDNDHCEIPSLRATANYMFFRHLGLFASVNLDLSVRGYNDRAFEIGETGPLLSTGSKVGFYPSYSIGIRF